MPSPAPFGVLVLPSDFALSTPAVYKEFDALGLGRDESELADLVEQIAVRGDGGDALPTALVHNDLQPAALSLRPELERTLALARESGADFVMVSGSGPTVVGLFMGESGSSRAQAAVATLHGYCPGACAAVAVEPDFAQPARG